MSKLGVYDSGLGGYTIARAIHSLYPAQDIVFLADQINVPYGNKSENELKDIIYQNMKWFVQQGVQQVIIACNTSSAVSLNHVERDFPQLVLRRIIDLTAEQIKEETTEEILVVATAYTIQTKSYSKAIQSYNKKIKVTEIALPQLASSIEAMASDTEIVNEFHQHLSDYYHRQIPVVLGCTHYPLVKDLFENYLQAGSYDSIQPVLNHTEFYTEGTGTVEYYTTKDPDYLKKQIENLFHEEIDVQYVEISSK